MSIERLNPLNDYLFLKFMGEKGDEEQLQAFLNAVLKRTGKDGLTSIEIIENKSFTPEIIGDKTSVLDLRAVMANGTRANIEVQLNNLGNMGRRSLFYWSREYSKSIKSGQDYKELPAVIAINIIDFELFETDDFHASFHLWEDENKDCLLTDALEIHFIDMVKFRRLSHKDIKNNDLHRWLTFFDKHTNAQTVEEVIKMDTAIQKAQNVITFVQGSEEDIHAYQMREMALCDYTSGMNYAWESGLNKGREEGREEGIHIGIHESELKIARNMKAAGISVNQIVALTGLTFDEIEGL